MEPPPEAQHTPTPWRCSPYLPYQLVLGNNDWSIRAADSMRYVAKVYDAGESTEANARRIVAAVNACQGIPTADLETGVLRDILARAAWVADFYDRTNTRQPKVLHIPDEVLRGLDRARNLWLGIVDQARQAPTDSGEVGDGR